MFYMEEEFVLPCFRAAVSVSSLAHTHTYTWNRKLRREKNVVMAQEREENVWLCGCVCVWKEWETSLPDGRCRAIHLKRRGAPRQTVDRE